MGRFYLLAVLSAILVPALLPSPTKNDAGLAKASLFATPTPIASDSTERKGKAPVPGSLHEALRQVMDSSSHAFEGDARCLAQAVYFEARSEPLEGQLAVAHVVLNRVDSPFWPDSICEVVFQNEQWRHRCQFSFACDGRSDNPKNPSAWRQAGLVAAVALNGLWRDVSLQATHYHADYVTPAWKDAMRPTTRFGRHLFYRDARHIAFSSDRSQTGSEG